MRLFGAHRRSVSACLFIEKGNPALFFRGEIFDVSHKKRPMRQEFRFSDSGIRKKRCFSRIFINLFINKKKKAEVRASL